MKKIITLSFVAITAINANDIIKMDSVVVEDNFTSKIVKDVSNENLKSADLAEALSKNLSNISLVRRSGIANDIILRGQKRDNINILIDESKIYGACPNRMDPPTSHVLANNIESVEVTEGPYDVENFGTLSGAVKVKTKKPKKGFSGEVNLNAGSFGYKKASTTLSGGNDKFRALISASTESSEQYKDGNGDTLAQQVDNKATVAGNKYSASNKNKDAYKKKTLMGKLYFNIDDKQEINFSYTANRSDDILYPNTPMDAIKDDSDIYAFNYMAKDLSKYSKELALNLYYSKVDHPMATTFRTNGAMEMTNNMKSKIKGGKIKNAIKIDEALYTFGLDTSVRTWEGFYSNKTNPYIADSISKTDTRNRAIFAKYEKEYGNLDIEVGSRYDRTDIETKGTQQDNDYNSLNAYIFGKYSFDDSLNYFAGFGKSSRVPDARELYFKKSGNLIGTPNLEQTRNYEFDLGFEKTVGDFKIKTKLFYSILKDFIAFNSNNMTSKFENVDAKIYGFDISGVYFVNDEIYFDYGLAMQKGKKDNALRGQTDRDLGDIPPLKTNIALNYELGKNKLRGEVIASKSWSSIDSDNGEQKLAGYAVLNLKAENKSIKNTTITFGVDNVFDKAYAASNTYNDLTLISAGGTNPMLLNEPGRYLYLNLKYSF